jgi:hypothetical protein
MSLGATVGGCSTLEGSGGRLGFASISLAPR